MRQFHFHEKQVGMLYDTKGIAYDNVTQYKDIMRFIRGSITGGSGAGGWWAVAAPLGLDSKVFIAK